MFAQIINQFGSAKIFELIDIEKPTPKFKEVLIKVKSTSINSIDIELRSGVVPHMAPEFPAILHGDIAGVIEAVGNGVTKFQIGDRVFGYAGGVRGINGALAEYMIADSELLAKIPEKLSYEEAALYPLIALTAWEGVIEKGRVQKKDKVLIQDGVGDVGHMAIQLAKLNGAEVYTTVKKDDMGLANLFGADVAIDYSIMTPKEYTEIYTENKGFDIVFDTIGGAHLEKSFEAVKPNGKIITTLANGNYNLSLLYRKGLTLSTIFMAMPLLDNIQRKEQGRKMEKIAELIEKGQLNVLQDNKTFELREIQKAHEYMESKKNSGKIGVKIHY